MYFNDQNVYQEQYKELKRKFREDKTVEEKQRFKCSTFIYILR